MQWWGESSRIMTALWNQDFTAIFVVASRKRPSKTVSIGEAKAKAVAPFLILSGMMPNIRPEFVAERLLSKPIPFRRKHTLLPNTLKRHPNPAEACKQVNEFHDFQRSAVRVFTLGQSPRFCKAVTLISS